MVGTAQRAVSNKKKRGVGYRAEIYGSPAPLSLSLPSHLFFSQTLTSNLIPPSERVERANCNSESCSACNLNAQLTHFTTILSPAYPSLTQSTLTTVFSFIVCFQDYFGSSLEMGSSLVRILSLVFKAKAMSFSSLILRRVLFKSWKFKPATSLSVSMRCVK